MCSLSYVSIDRIVDCILKLEKGALMAQNDIKQAYRNILVHPMDRYLIGVQWKGELYIDKVLPFGLRSAPYHLFCHGRCPSVDRATKRCGIHIPLLHYSSPTRK